MIDPRLSGAETPLCFAVAGDTIVVCSTQFVINARLCGALAGVGIARQCRRRLVWPGFAKKKVRWIVFPAAYAKACMAAPGEAA
jgi:hypothetical protein